MIDSALRRNIGALFSVRVAGYIVPLITLPLLIRVLGADGYGKIAFSFAIIQYSVLIVNYGFEMSLTKKIAIEKNVDVISDIFWSVTFLRLAIMSIGFVVLIFLSYVLGVLVEIRNILLASYLITIGTSIFPQWLFQGKEELAKISLIQTVLHFINIPLLLMFVSDKEDILAAAIILSLPVFLTGFFSIYIVYKKKWIVWFAPNRQRIFCELRAGWELFLSKAAINIYTSTVIIVLGITSGPSSVGIFVAAHKLIQAAQAILAPISTAFYPRICSAVEYKKESVKNILRLFLKIQLSITALISFFIFSLSSIIIDTLYGQELTESVVVLNLLSAIPFVVGVSNAFGVQMLLTHGYKKVFSNILVFTSMFSLVLLYPITLCYKETGAALVILSTEVVISLLMYTLVLKKNIKF